MIWFVLLLAIIFAAAWLTCFEQKRTAARSYESDIYDLCTHLEICLCQVAAKHSKETVDLMSVRDQVERQSFAIRPPYALEMLERREKEIKDAYQFERDANKLLDSVARRRGFTIRS